MHEQHALILAPEDGPAANQQVYNSVYTSEGVKISNEALFLTSLTLKLLQQMQEQTQEAIQANHVTTCQLVTLW